MSTMPTTLFTGPKRMALPDDPEAVPWKERPYGGDS